MNIINKQPKQMRFYDLEKGAVFQDGGSFYMKTEFIETEEIAVNAVELKTGNLVAMFDSAVVTPLNCNLVIE